MIVNNYQNMLNFIYKIDQIKFNKTRDKICLISIK